MIRAIAFDAVGTLIHPEPAAWEVYESVGRRYGSKLSPAVIRVRFQAAFKQQEELDWRGALRTSEGRELLRWRAIVTQVLTDVTNPAACFAELYDHFRRPGAWRVTTETASVLADLKSRGLRLALASNYDERLREVCAGLSELQAIDKVVISSEVGWRKPAPEFFAALCRELRTPADHVLFVGDDPANDIEGARRAGLQTLLYDPACGLAALLANAQTKSV